MGLEWAGVGGALVLLLTGEGLAAVCFTVLWSLGQMGGSEEKGFAAAAFIFVVVVGKVMRWGQSAGRQKRGGSNVSEFMYVLDMFGLTGYIVGFFVGLIAIAIILYLVKRA